MGVKVNEAHETQGELYIMKMSARIRVRIGQGEWVAAQAGTHGSVSNPLRNETA